MTRGSMFNFNTLKTTILLGTLTGFAFQNLFSSHPPTHERVARLRQLAQEGRGVA